MSVCMRIRCASYKRPTTCEQAAFQRRRTRHMTTYRYSHSSSLYLSLYWMLWSKMQRQHCNHHANGSRAHSHLPLDIVFVRRLVGRFFLRHGCTRACAFPGTTRRGTWTRSCSVESHRCCLDVVVMRRTVGVWLHAEPSQFNPI